MTKRIASRHHMRLSRFAEAFNLVDVANLTGCRGVLNHPDNGRPGARVGQLFAIHAPRALPFAARMDC